MTQISTNDIDSISPYLKAIKQPDSLSHKGQNGKVLIVGGSSLFHAAVLWSAEAAAHIVDMVHVASTDENNEIIKQIKVKWYGGMVVPQKDIVHYAEEDNVILVGNGMMRVGGEGEYTKKVVKDLISHFPDKQFVFDAGALQMMDPGWLKELHKQAVITPHQKEFQTLFGTDLHELTPEDIEVLVAQKAKEYNCIILLKAIDDIVSNGAQTVRIAGGNAGLTKGGTGDILAGLVAGMSTTSDPFASSIVSSYLLKKTAEEIAQTRGLWYTAQDILTVVSTVFCSLRDKTRSLTLNDISGSIEI
jgi:NAD(P)H-hydrate epimerase